jgi:hypothetical protein
VLTRQGVTILRGKLDGLFSEIWLILFKAHIYSNMGKLQPYCHCLKSNDNHRKRNHSAMKYIVTHDVQCGLIVPKGTQLEIDRFTFLSDSEGNLAKRIRTEVEATTNEEAYRKSQRLITQFLPRLTLVDNGQYILSGSYSIQEGGAITGRREVPPTVSLGRDGNFIKEGFEKNIEGKRLRSQPLINYAAGFHSNDPFTQFRNFYLVLEFYLTSTGEITRWIVNNKPDIEMKKGEYGNKITIISWIRHKISDAKKGTKGLDPLLISNPQHVELVKKYVPVVRELAREIIREREKV